MRTIHLLNYLLQLTVLASPVPNFLSIAYSKKNLLLSFIIALTGCTATPRAIPIEIPIETLNQEFQDAYQSSFFAEEETIPQNWWELFEDPQLNAFIETTFEKNPTLHSAQANIFQARANANLARSSLFPYFSWVGDISRQKLSKTGVIPFGPSPPGTTVSNGTTVSPVTVGAPITPGGTSGIPVYFTQYESEINLSYEIDLWGKNQNRLAAAVGEVQAAIADKAFTRLQLGVAFAQTYFRLQINYKREEVAKAILENQSNYDSLVKQRVSGNLDAAPTYHTAQTNLSGVKQALLQIQGNIAIDEFQLKAYLAGHFDEEIERISIEKASLPKIPLPKELPLHLIAHRPDIVSKLWILESAGKQIEVAKAGFYPDVNLNAFFGFQTIHPQDFFKWPSRFFNIDPAFSLPIFDGGRLLANLDYSLIQYDEVIFEYNELILNTVRDILTGISLLKNSYEQLEQFKQKYDEQKMIFNLTQMRLKNNLSSGLDYLTSEQSMLTALDQELTSLGNTIQIALSLIKSLGGGYEVDYCTPF